MSGDSGLDERAVGFWLRLNERERGVMAASRPSAGFRRLAARIRQGEKLIASLQAQKERILSEALTES